MDDLAPLLIVLYEIERSLRSGETAASGLKSALRLMRDSRCKDAFHLQSQLSELLGTMETSSMPGAVIERGSTVYRRELMRLVVEASMGQPILSRVEALLRDVEQVTECDIQSYVESLPRRLMVPLLLVQFPAFLLLLLGPLTLRLIGDLAK